MVARDTAAEAKAFADLRPDLVALAYRMLGDVARAEDVTQEAWLRWQQRDVEVDSPRAYLVTIVTRLSLNELASARARREERRGDRLPEPIDLDQGGMGKLEELEQVSMAFMVILQKLSPAERAVLLLHDVFDFGHDEIAALVGRNAASCRKLLERARQDVAAGRRMATASREEHRRLLQAFLGAAAQGDVTTLVDLLAADAILVTDGGPEGSARGAVRNLRAPLQGAERVAAFVVAASRNTDLEVEERELNGRPAIVFFSAERPFAALLLAVADDKIQRVFFFADATRLARLARDRRV